VDQKQKLEQSNALLTTQMKELSQTVQSLTATVDEKGKEVNYLEEQYAKERISAKSKLDELNQEIDRKTLEFQQEKEKLQAQIQDLNRVLQQDQESKMKELTKMLEQKVYIVYTSYSTFYRTH
jgi:hypothetical protein